MASSLPIDTSAAAMTTTTSSTTDDDAECTKRKAGKVHMRHMKPVRQVQRVEHTRARTSTSTAAGPLLLLVLLARAGLPPRHAVGHY